MQQTVVFSALMIGQPFSMFPTKYISPDAEKIVGPTEKKFDVTIPYTSEFSGVWGKECRMPVRNWPLLREIIGYRRVSPIKAPTSESFLVATLHCLYAFLVPPL
jgi:hypothetical protein